MALDGATRLELDPGDPVEVWTEPDALRRRARSHGDDGFEAAYASARKARGFVRRVETPLRVGDEVWVYGLDGPSPSTNTSTDTEVTTIGGVAVSGPRRPLIADFDPRPWVWRKANKAILVALGMVLLSLGCTIAVFWPPQWGVVSKLGAVAAIAVFNLQQLFLKQVRDGSRLPPFAHVRGTWQGPRS